MFFAEAKGCPYAMLAGMNLKGFIPLLLLFFAPFFVNAGSEPDELVITHVTVIDATGAASQDDMTVVIKGNRIAAIKKSAPAETEKEARVVDASGKYLIPGLWDMHVHLFNHVNPGPPGEYYFPLLIANGVTSVRDMWTKLDDVEQVQKWRKQFSEGATIPRIVLAGTLIDGANPVWPEADTVAIADDARKMVDKVKAGGADFVKVYWNLSREEYFAIADECRKQGIPFAGHVPFSVSAAEASDSGQRSIEHLTEISFTCSAKEKEFRKVDPKKWGPKYEMEVLRSFDQKKCEGLFSRFVKNRTWQVPTLVIYHKLILKEAELLSDDRLKYIPASKREEWKSFFDLMKNRTPEQADYGNRLWQTNLNLVGAMRRAGVEFMAGTDMGIAVSYIYAGFSLHDELALLVQAGFTPMEALQAGTRNASRFAEKLDSIGTIEQGKIADLVLLDANPLENITNTQKIDAVILDGKLISKESLQQMLAEVEASARGGR